MSGTLPEPPNGTSRIRDMPAPRLAEGVAGKPMRWVFTWPYRVILLGVYRAGFRPWHLTLLGLVRHLTEVERGWIAEDFLGQDLPPLYSRPGAPDADFTELEADRLQADLAAWRAECARTDEVVRAHSLDESVQHERMVRRDAVEIVPGRMALFRKQALVPTAPENPPTR